jgi:hypothetical protein
MRDLPLLRHPLLILAAALVLLPLLTGALGLPISIASEIALFALVGLGFNLLLGYTGLLSFGHGAFFGLAAYAAALFQLHLAPGSFLLPIAFAVALAALSGLVIGFLVLRRRGVYFSLLTLAFTAMAFYIVYRWTSFTSGENGLGGITRPDLLGVDLDDQTTFYVLTAVVVFLAACLIWRVVCSPFGRVLVAIRENEDENRDFSSTESRRESTSAVAQFSMPLFEGGYAWSRTRQSRINVDRAEARTEAQRREVIANVSAAWSNLTASREVLTAADEQVEASAIAVEGAERERGYGLRSTLEVLDAEEEARNALIGRVRANAESVVASYALLAAAGALTLETATGHSN